MFASKLVIGGIKRIANDTKISISDGKILYLNICLF